MSSKNINCNINPMGVNNVKSDYNKINLSKEKNKGKNYSTSENTNKNLYIPDKNEKNTYTSYKINMKNINPAGIEYSENCENFQKREIA